MGKINLGELEKAFEGTNFGEVVMSSTDKKLAYTLKALTERLYGYHTGWTITQIMIELGLLTPKNHIISKKGLRVLRQYRDDQKNLEKQLADYKEWMTEPIVKFQTEFQEMKKENEEFRETLSSQRNLVSRNKSQFKAIIEIKNKLVESERNLTSFIKRSERLEAYIRKQLQEDYKASEDEVKVLFKVLLSGGMDEILKVEPLPDKHYQVNYLNYPEKVLIRAVEREINKCFLEFGASINFPWLTEEGKQNLCGSAALREIDPDKEEEADKAKLAAGLLSPKEYAENRAQRSKEKGGK